MNIEETLEKEGKIAYTNVGLSMMPWIREGKDIMIIKKLEEKPKKYDSVLFIRPEVVGRGRYVLHRVMKILPNDQYYIIGDNTTRGEIVKLENILGKLITIKRDGKNIDVEGKKHMLLVKLWWCFGFPTQVAYKKFKSLVKKLIRYDSWKK